MITQVGIIGSGTMGSGIAQVAATAGCKVWVYDNKPEALETASKKLHKVLGRLVEKERLTHKQKDAILNNIQFVSDLQSLKNTTLVIEAIVENLEIKKTLFQELEALVSKETILASNTSSLSIASIASALELPERMVGIHFFNPAPLMKLVEVIPAVQTSKETTTLATTTISKWGKTVAVAKDTPGFIVNRVARPFYGEALRIYEEGLADFETIDWAMKHLGGFRMGPFELMDFIGNDINYTVTETVFKAFYYDSRYKPSFTQKRMVEAGYLGRKTQRGFYKYEAGKLINKPQQEADASLAEEIFTRILVMLINEAADALYMQIASAKDIDAAMTKGVNYPKGLLAWANEKAIEWCVTSLDAHYNKYHEPRYRCAPILRKMAATNTTFL